MLLIGLTTVAVLVSGKVWPNIEFTVWTIFLTAIAFYLYIDLSQPVNYKSIAISEDAIEYVGLGNHRDVILLSEITKLEYVRSQAIFESGIESMWMIHTMSDVHFEVLDEWPHRRQLLRTFKKHLPGFDYLVANKGLRAWKKGKWLCFESQPNIGK